MTKLNDNNFKPIITVLIDQRNEDGSIKTAKYLDKNGKEQVREYRGGVVFDRINEGLGYVYNSSKYDEYGNRKLEEGVTAKWDWRLN